MSEDLIGNPDLQQMLLCSVVIVKRFKRRQTAWTEECNTCPDRARLADGSDTVDRSDPQGRKSWSVSPDQLHGSHGPDGVASHGNCLPVVLWRLGADLCFSGCEAIG